MFSMYILVKKSRFVFPLLSRKIYKSKNFRIWHFLEVLVLCSTKPIISLLNKFLQNQSALISKLFNYFAAKSIEFSDRNIFV